MSAATTTSAGDAPMPLSSSGSASASAPALPSVLLVLGCTGAGKTKLSLDLCRAFNAEVVSADSIQVYAGLPIASNQLSAEEAQGVPHHLIGVLPPHRAMHVHQFRRAANKLIQRITAQGKNVVIVGGTFYWIESILYKTLTSSDDMETDEPQQQAAGAAGQDENKQAPAAAAMVEEDASSFSYPASAPLTLADLQSLATESIASLPLDHLAFACSMLLARMPLAASSPSSPAAMSLLRHLSSALSTTQFQKLLAAMHIEDVRNVRFVSAILNPPDGTAAASSASTAAAASSSSSAAVSVTAAPAALAALVFPSPHLYSLLVLVDEGSSHKLHPNDVRKLRRALEVFVVSGGRNTLSELVAQSGGKHGGDHGLQVRVQALWVDCGPEVLEARLDRRVDDMMRRGLLTEVENMYKQLWQRQQRQRQAAASSSAAAAVAEEPWVYDNPLDPNCDICANVESRDISLPLSVPSSTAAAAAPPSDPSSSSATIAAATSASAYPPSFLGLDELHLDWERGIGQALGFKEFRPYFKLKFHSALPSTAAASSPSSSSASSSSAVAPDSPPSKRRKTAAASSSTASAASSATSAAAASTAVDPALASFDASLQSCLASCVQSLKDRTRSYARVQARWIKTRFWPTSVAATTSPGSSASSSSSAMSILRLDSSLASDPAAWNAQVSQPALEVCGRFLAGQNVDLHAYAHLAKQLPALPVSASSSAAAAAALAASSSSSSSSSAAAAAASTPWMKHHCESCDVMCNGSMEWEKHLTSKRHRTGSTRVARKQQQMERMEEVRKEREQKKAAAAAAAASLPAAPSSSL